MKIGHWVKNGTIKMEAPQRGQGINLVDEQGNRKILIGKLDDGSYGGEFIGSKLYSSLFQTGAPTGTSYIALVPPNGLVAYYNGNKILETWTNSGQGHLFFYEDGVKCGTISAGGQATPTFYIYGGGVVEGYKRIYMQGNPVELHCGDSLEVTAGYTYMNTRFTGSLLPYFDNSGYVGNNTYKWNTVRAQFITPGDLCWEERECAVCGQPFKDGDKLIMLVRTVHEEHGTMTIPIHEHCKDAPATLTLEVPEVESRFRLKEDGQVEEYKVSKFADVQELIRNIKEGYELDEQTGEFKKKPFVVKVAKDDSCARVAKYGVKYYHGMPRKEVSLKDILEDVEIFPGGVASKEEAVEIVSVTRKKQVMKTITVNLGNQ